MATYEKIKRSLQDVSYRYNKLLVLVGKNEGIRTEALHKIKQNHNCEYFNLNEHLSENLLTIPESERPIIVFDLLDHLRDKTGETFLLLDFINILFLPELSVDPIRALLNISRKKIVIASWPGSYINNDLIYAESWHPEHYIFRDADKDCSILEL